jgi:transposase
MTQFARPTSAAADYDSTIIGALELSEKKWVLAVQLPGVKRHSRHVVEARGDELAAFVERLKARCAVAGHNIKRVILTHEAGRDGFWLARFLVRRGVEVHVMQPSSLPVDRRARRAKTDVIDVEMLLRSRPTPWPFASLVGVDAFAGELTRGIIGTIPATIKIENTQRYRVVLWLRKR